MAQTKKCIKCSKRKSISSFWVRSDNGKPRNTCNDCQRKQAFDRKARK